MSGDPEQDYFADGIVEEMITALSRMRWLFVIARNSSFTYKGRIGRCEAGRPRAGRALCAPRQCAQGRPAAADHGPAGRCSDGREPLGATVSKARSRMSSTCRIKVTASVMAAISPQLEKAEIARAKRKPTESLDAYDTYLRGMAAFHLWTREGTEEALRYFYRAIELGPDLAAAYAMAATAYARRKGSGWVEDRDQEIAEIKRLARQAASLGQDDAVALSFSGFSLAQTAGELDDAAGLVERALQLNPNLAPALVCSGWVNVWLGEQDLAIEHVSLAIRLSPLDPLTHMMLIAAAHAHFFAGRFEESAHSAELALRVNSEARPGVRIAAASYALAGRDAEARKMLARYLRLDSGEACVTGWWQMTLALPCPWTARASSRTNCASSPMEWGATISLCRRSRSCCDGTRRVPSGAGHSDQDNLKVTRSTVTSRKNWAFTRSVSLP